MSVFDDIFGEAGVPSLMETMGTAEVVYLAPEEDPVTLTAIVSNMEVAEAEGAAGGRRKRAVRTITIAKDPDGPYGGVEFPAMAATIELPDGEVWAIEGIEAQGESLTRLSCVRKTAVELSRAGYRSR